MQSDYYINLHFNQAVAQRTGYAFKIGDKGCTFHLHCEDLDPSGMFPHIVFNHPNNTCVEGVPTGSGRDYAYTIAGNEFGVCGKTVVDLKFYDNNNDATQRISTASFMIEIIPDTYTDFEESSSSYADSLERAREEIDAAILDLQGAEHDLEEAEGDLDNMSGQFADTLQDYIDAFGNTAPINPRGAYVAATEYHPRDAVEYTAGGKTLTYINRSACTGIAPTDPDHGAEHWQIMIDVSVGGSFSALSDVSVDPQTLADGQMPVYNGTDQVWENKTILENSLTSTATDLALTAAQGKELQDNKQPKTLETAITIAGTSKTTVEGALGGLNDYVDDTVEAAFDVYGSKNLFPYPYDETTKTENGITFTDNGDGTITISNIASADTFLYLHDPSKIYLKNGQYKLSGTPHFGDTVKLRLYLSYKDTNNNTVVINVDNNTATGENTFTINGSYGDTNGAACNAYIKIFNGADCSTPVTFYPMIRDARVVDDTFVPFAMTNRQLTENLAANNTTVAANIAAYSENNPYIAPCDGYGKVALTSTLNATGYLMIKGESGSYSIEIGAGSTTQYTEEAIFVKKGMKLYPVTGAVNATFVFYGLS